MQPRILHFITRLGLGGAESVALSLVRGLHAEFEFGVFAVRGIERSEVGRAMQRELAELRVPVFCGPNLSLKYGGMLFAGLRATQVLRQFNPAAVHLHTEIPESAYAASATLRSLRPPPAAVRTIHNSVYWQFWPRLGAWCERRLRFSHVACVSQDAHSAFTGHRQRSRAGALPAPSIVIYNGVASPTCPADRQPAPNTPIRVLFAGRFESEKGADLLPNVIARARPPAQGAELFLHGHGVHRPALESLAAHPPHGWIIHVQPPVANLRAHMPDFDLVLIPSRHEGLPLVAVEAMLAGVPVIGTDAPGLREALPPDHRWRARAGDADDFALQLQRAMNKPDAWRAAAAHARAFASSRFNYETMLAAYAALYRRAIGPGTTA